MGRRALARGRRAGAAARGRRRARARFALQPGRPRPDVVPAGRLVERPAAGPARRSRRDARLRRSARTAATCASSSPRTSRGRAGCAPIPSSWSSCAGFRHGLSLVARALGARRGARARDGGSVRAAAPRDRRGERPGASTRSRWTRGARAPTCSRGHRPAAVACSPRAPVPDRRRAASRPAGGRDRVGGATGGLVVEDDYDGELRYDRQPVGALQALAPAQRRLRRHRQQDARARACGSAGWSCRRSCSSAISTCARPRTCTSRRPSRSRSAELLRSGGYERHVRRMRARYRGSPRPPASRCSPSARRRSCPWESQPASRCCSSSPTAARRAAELDRRGGQPLDRAAPAGAALPRRRARRATAS